MQTRIQLDRYGWYHIILQKPPFATLQCFRTEKECRQWLADTWRIRNVLYPQG
jgi:hypothetical protein